MNCVNVCNTKARSLNLLLPRAEADDDVCDALFFSFLTRGRLTRTLSAALLDLNPTATGCSGASVGERFPSRVGSYYSQQGGDLPPPPGGGERESARTLTIRPLIPLIPKIQHDVMQIPSVDCSSRNRVMCALD